MKKSLLAIVALVTLIAACKKDEQNVNLNIQQEVLTTLTLRFKDNADTSQKFSFTFRTSDGVAFGRPPKLDTIFLKPSKSYEMAVTILDESKAIPVDQTVEINELNLEHQFFYYTFPSGLVTFPPASFNKGQNGGQLGTLVNAVFTSSASSNGFLRVILRHQPVKSNPNVAQNDTTYAGGETDIAVTYPLVIK